MKKYVMFIACFIGGSLVAMDQPTGYLSQTIRDRLMPLQEQKVQLLHEIEALYADAIEFQKQIESLQQEEIRDEQRILGLKSYIAQINREIGVKNQQIRVIERKMQLIEQSGLIPERQYEGFFE